MIYLPDTNACITFLRQKNSPLIAKWRARRSADITLCSIVAYELRYGAERAAVPASERAKLDAFLGQFTSIPFDDRCATECARIRYGLERVGLRIGPYDLQIAATAVAYGLTVVTHNTREFNRVGGLSVEDWEL